MGRDVTDGVMTIALVVVCTSGILNAPFEMHFKMFFIYILLYTSRIRRNGNHQGSGYLQCIVVNICH